MLHNWYDFLVDDGVLPILAGIVLSLVLINLFRYFKSAASNRSKRELDKDEQNYGM